MDVLDFAKSMVKTKTCDACFINQVTQEFFLYLMGMTHKQFNLMNPFGNEPRENGIQSHEVNLRQKRRKLQA
jgi:hypothetical protein